MNELSLFTGMGGGIYGSMILGWNTIAYVEKDEYCQKVIAQRIKDDWFDNGEIYGDIKEFNEKHAEKYTGKIDVLTGGFPCQPHSLAGKRNGAGDERYLLNEIIKTIEVIRPEQIFFENVYGLLTDPAIIDIYKKLERAGYTTRPPLLLGSSDCGNIHKRTRVWIYATDSKRRRWPKVLCSEGTSRTEESGGSKTATHDTCSGERASEEKLHNTNSGCKRVHGGREEAVQRKQALQRCESIRGIEDLYNRPDIPNPLFCGVDDELPNWRKQLKAIGNGQDPIVMATAYKLLTGGINE